MSWTEDRAEIAAALSSVTDVRGYEYRPSAPKPGDAWPLLSRLDLQDGLCWRPTWVVIVVLPSDEKAMGAWIDGHFMDIVAALRGPAFAESAEPVVLQTSGGDMYVLEITLRSE